mmetsp:Transcript_35989/g.74817  ORF Transcript_35989/g.74817 Transcript_35989/m.74817 type:complete len:203 (-) Transcript_35989:186-794(-)
MSHHVSQRTAHGQSRNIHVAQPNTRRSINTIIIFDRKDTASTTKNSFLFLWGIRLVVQGDILECQATVFFPAHNDARIPNVHSGQCISTDNGHGEGGSAEFGINAVVSEHITLYLGNRVGRCLLQVGGPGRVVEHLRDELIPEGLGNTIPMLSVSIQNTQYQSVGGGIVSHNERVLVLFAGIVGSVSLFRDTRILRDGTTHG